MSYVLAFLFVLSGFISLVRTSDTEYFMRCMTLAALFSIAGNLGAIYHKLKEKFG